VSRATESDRHSSLSEINIGFDVYSDRFGLEYWLHEENSKWRKKGDLYWCMGRDSPNLPTRFAASC